MKEYKVIVDGLVVGILELSRDDVKALSSDKDIKVVAIGGDKYPAGLEG